VKALFPLLLCFMACSAHAAKLFVTLTTPDKNTDDTPLTDLASIEIEWGTCTGAEFVRQSGVLIAFTEPGAQLKSPIYPSGLTQVCVRAFAYNMQGAKSASSNFAVKDLLPGPGKPVALDQPIILSFNTRSN